MDQQTLQMIQRGLIAAVSIVLALIVITAFRGLLSTPTDTIPRRTTTTAAAQTTVEETTTTTTVAAASATTTTDVSTPAVCLEDEPSSEAATVLRVFYPCGSEDLAIAGTFVYRTIPQTDLVLTATMSEMAKGLEDGEEALGFRSPFPSGAAGAVLGVSIVDGVAYVEFTDDIFPAGADTAEGAQIFLSTLNANVFQFDTIDAVQYRLGGSCDAFWQHLGGQCEEMSRSEWQSQLISQ